MSHSYRKTFSDRYAMLHEQQILDYLNQRNAPVPKVKLSHMDDSYLEMTHGGMNLSTWIQTTQPGFIASSHALAQAIEAVLDVARLWVWHVDIALRNFVIQEANDGYSPKVLLIDFSNSFSPRFPLQKPLWMLPTPLQHPQLRQSLILDWQAFYARHLIPPPERWDQIFEVPMTLYQEDWSTGLNVESMQNPWCVISHGIGQMILQDKSGWREILQSHSYNWTELLDLDDDYLAMERLQFCMDQLRNPSQFDSSTPRPQISTLTSIQVKSHDEVQQINHLTSHDELQLISDVNQRSSTQHALSQNMPKVWWHELRVMFSIALVVVGWVMFDVIYTIFWYPLSWLSWTGIGFALVGTIWALWFFFFSDKRKRSWVFGIWIHEFALSLLLIDAWLLHMPVLFLVLIFACLIVSTVLAWTFKS